MIPLMSKVKFTSYALKQHPSKEYRQEIINFSQIQPINWKITKIPQYNKFEKMDYVNISPKPFAYMPSKKPMWLAELGLSGIWWILNIPNISDTLSFGECIDICNSLMKLEEIKEQNRKKKIQLFSDNWYNAMKNYLTEVVRNKNYCVKLFII